MVVQPIGYDFSLGFFQRRCCCQFRLFLGKTSLSITGSLLGANAYMLATGFVATVTPKPMSYIWYIVSCAAYLAIIYLLVQPYRVQAERKHPRSKQAFRKLVTVHLVLWTLYPIVWILSPEGFSSFGQGSETMFYTLLDIACELPNTDPYGYGVGF